MRWPRLALAGVLALSFAACGRSKAGGGEEGATSGQPAAQAAAPESTAAPPSAPTTAPATRPAAPAVRRTTAVDEPWTPADTGTVRPGMNRADVIAVWGKPVAERTVDGREYLYYRNGCEASCGTFDVVFLEGGQVVDAIVRGRGHTYAGTSSSPAGAEGQPTPPGQSGS